MLDESTAVGGDPQEGVAPDPREVLAAWANEQDEWVRAIVRQVLNSGRALPAAALDAAHSLFRQEKGIDERTLPSEAPLAVDLTEEDAALPLAVTKLSEVTGVNAIVPGSVIEPHAGMTILFGENGTGKTGYSRIFKALAGSRTADTILGNVAAEEVVAQTAKVEYTLGPDAKVLEWTGEQGVSPFTRMSIFDSPSVNFHVDDDLEYVYVPTVLSLFNHVNAALKGVHDRVDVTIRELASGSTTLLSRFPRESTIYPFVETLGASTDLAALHARADRGSDVDQRIDFLRRAVAALEADTLSTQIAERVRAERVQRQASKAAATLEALDVEKLNSLHARLVELQQDYRTFRTELFAAADLPADPDETWDAFVTAGEGYRAHLEVLGVHDSERCLYCRQQLSDPAKALVAKYGEYLSDKISLDIAETHESINVLTRPILAVTAPDVTTFLAEHQDQEEKPGAYADVSAIQEAVVSLSAAIRAEDSIDTSLVEDVPTVRAALDASLVLLTDEIADLRTQSENRSDALKEKKNELAELIAAGELGKSWPTIQAQVERAKEADRLRMLAGRFTALGRSVTELAKAASDQLVNHSFEVLFTEECMALRAPELRIEFVGRQGRAHRRKTFGGRHKPSKILSEGEQKVLALADFLAEARLSGITAPVIFDDPVSSLDHRRINEVARRIASLADHNQVIVFTHDIFFAATLLSLFETSKRCTYFQITDDDGKGQVTRASGPRWDSLGNLRANINKTIEAARAVEGEARAALVREGYDWIRSWCEVFTEVELLAGVSQRYQPNIRMTTLANIKAGALPAASEVVVRIFEDACGFIAGHSQPLVTLGVSPTLPGLEIHWKELQEARSAYLAAQS
ncbi:AAA family ATPase [Propioniciclava sp. MC1595]|uniref:AAA family ATPase n=1 Tax=Propioniciclava sp. MC1595 TaxID=2760308 RepID=UPI00166249FF|nr:AAA family ATPase [Propioniciclava sp. MC1595]MBB1496485.1 AAA family ATPase [Propioniciclava sp. MC1595]QTE26269.1 AAA family ATPase [Propioniciclava sp. MC1595]